MNPLFLTATSPHRCDICAGPILIGERFYRHEEARVAEWSFDFQPDVIVRTDAVRECASCADQAGRWTQ